MKKRFDSIVVEIGEFVDFCFKAFLAIFRRPFRHRVIVEQMERVGLQSLPIIVLVSLFTGMVFALQSTYSFRMFGAETLVGATVGLSLSREIAPVFASLMIIARVGSSIAAEIGTMKVTEQIDAIKSMAVSPTHYLVAPRVLATTVMMPLHTIIFNFVGVLGAYLVGVGLLGIPKGPFVARLKHMVEVEDILGGVIKALIFGFVMGAMCCYQGYKTEQGAKGVGLSTTRAVVVSSVVILVIDYFLTQIILEVF